METVKTALTEPQTNALLLGLVDKSHELAREYLKTAHMTLHNLIARPDLLNGVSLNAAPGTYTRNFLFGCGDISIWAITWAPGSHTSIHDHRCSCCFGILQGKLTEIRYQTVGDARVTERERYIRDEGFIDCLLPTGPNIHMMCNESDQVVVSIHIYGYDHRLHSSSILQEYTTRPA